jgi:hypothetical protein
MSSPIFHSFGGNKNTYTGLMSEATTPLVDEIKRYELARKNRFGFFGRVDYIPLLEGADATVKFLENMATTTPTICSCNNLYLRYMGRELTVKRKSSNFDIGEEEQPLNLNDSKDFVNTLEAMLGGDYGMSEFKDAMEKAAYDMLVYGNACIEIKKITKGKAKGARIKALDFAHFRYENTKDEQELGDWGIYCEDFLNVNYDRNINFIKYAIFPNFSLFEDGTERSIHHIKSVGAARKWYGLPYSVGSLYAQYLEYQHLKYNSLAFNKKLIPDLALMIEKQELANDEDIQENKEKMERFDEKYTSSGKNAKKVAGVMPIYYNTGETPPILHQIKSTADTNYFKFISQDSSEKIRSTCGVNEILLEKGGNNLSGGNALYQAAMSFYNVQVSDYKAKLLVLFNDVIKNLFDWVGYENNANLVIDLKPPKFLDVFATFGEFQKPAAPQQTLKSEQAIIEQSINSEQDNSNPIF